MTPEVKQRIEQIRQGIVPEGYKKTKSDIVPVDWKESSIGEYICEYTEKTTIPNQYPVLTSARTGLMLQTEYYSNRQVTTENNVGYNILPFGYVTFRSRSDDGRFRFNENRIIKRGIISYFYPVFSFSEEVCHEYMLYLLNFSIYRRMYSYAEGTAQQVLSLKKLGQLKYSLPLVAEQKKIAEILATQDKAIELQGRKIEELKRFKKGCLERMFPRKGQKVPEKRFPGYTDDWEQRKVLSCIQKITDFRGRTPKKLGMDWSESGYLALSALNVKDGYIDFSQDVHYGDQALYDKWMSGNELHKGQVLFTTEAPMGNVAQVPDNRQYILSQRTIAFDVREDIITENFLATLLRSPAVFNTLTSLSSGGTAKGVSQKSLAGVDVRIPVDLREQTLLATYFHNIDNLITLHQRKLDEMKKQKKALMQLLLTGIVRVRL